MEFHNFILRFDPFTTIYRGVTRLEYLLIPKVGREDPLKKNEIRLLEEFKKRSFPHLNINTNNYWALLALAQHHGLPTRLLDWTRNPLVAVYFAIQEEGEHDCAIYIINSSELNQVLELDPDELPFTVKEIMLFDPDHITPRIIVQNGVFTVHSDPLDVPLDEKVREDSKTNYQVDKVIIKGNSKTEFRKILNIYGINKASLFPGLDGIADYLEWITKMRGGET